MERRFQGHADDYEIFRMASPYYDQIESLVGSILKKNIEKNSSREMEVLEIGTGTGITTRIILDADRRMILDSIDNEPDMLRHAKASLAGCLKSGRLKLIEADALGFLKSRSKKYDAVASAFTLHNLPMDYRENLLKEIFRVLKPGGMFVNADKYAIDDLPAHKKALKWQLDMIESAFTKIKRPDLAKFWTDHYLEDDKPPRQMKQDVYMELAGKIGFKKTNVVCRKHLDAVLVSVK